MERSDGPVNEAARRAFERHRLDGGTQPLEDFLPSRDDPAYTGTLEELVCIDLEMRYRAWSVDGRGTAPPDASAYQELVSGVGDAALLDRVADEAEWLRKRHSASLSAGSRIGRYQLVAPLGRGAFAVVWRARDAELDRDVALKAPRPDLVDDVHVARRLLREAQSAARLHHPGIVPVHEVGEHEGRPYVVSELIEGETLARRLSRGKFAPDAAARLAIELADALEYAHSCGVVHRDVKPGNVLLREGGRPLLADFGLARLGSAESSLTREGDLLGTPAYMAPEQARGDTSQVGPTSDVYALGAVLYELLTGSAPFEGASAASVLYSVLHEDPAAPRSVTPAIPRDLDTICGKAMAKEADRRYASAADLAADLRRFLSQQPIHARRMGPAERVALWARRNRALAGTLVGAIVVIAIVTATAFARIADERDRYRQQRDESNANLFRAFVGEARTLAIARDGPWLAQAREKLAAAAALPDVARDDDTLREAATTLETRPWPSIEPSAAWSTSAPVRRLLGADDAIVSLLRDGTLERRDAATGAVLASVALGDDVVDVAAGVGVVAVAIGRHVTVLDSATLEERITWEGIVTVSALAAQPDGGALAVGAEDGSVELLRLTDRLRSEWRSTTHAGSVTALAFLVDGNGLLSGGADRMLRRLAADSGAVEGEQATRDPPRVLNVTSVHRFQLATNEQLGFADGDPRQLRTLNRRDGVERDAVVAVRRVDPLHILTVAADGALSVYDGDARVTRSRAEAAQVVTAWIDRPGQRVLVANADGGIEIHTVEFPAAVRRVVGGHRARFLPDRPIFSSVEGLVDARRPEDVPELLGAPGVTSMDVVSQQVVATRRDGAAVALGRNGKIVPLGDARIVAASPSRRLGVMVSGQRAMRVVPPMGRPSPDSSAGVEIAAVERIRAVAFLDEMHVAVLGPRSVVLLRVDGRFIDPEPVAKCSITGPRAPVIAASGRRIYIAAPEGGVELRTRPTLELEVDIAREHGHVSALRVSPDGEHLWVGSHDAVRVFLTGGDIERRRFSVEDATAIAFSQHYGVAFLGGARGASLWDLKSGRILGHVFGRQWRTATFASPQGLIAARHGGGAWRFAPSSLYEIRDRHRELVAAGAVIDVPTLIPDEAPLPTTPRRIAWGFDVSADGGRLATSDHEGALTIWDAASREPLRTIAVGAEIAWDVRYALDGRRVACGHGNETVLFDAETGRQLARVTAHTKMVTAVEWIGTDAVLSGSHDGRVIAHNPRTLEVTATLLDGDESVLGLAVHRDNRRVVAGTHDGRVLLLDAFGQRDVETVFDAEDDSVWALAWDRTGRRLALATRRGRIVILRDGTWEPLLDLSLGLRLPRGLTFDSTGERLGIACYFAASQLLDLAALTERLTELGLE